MRCATPTPAPRLRGAAFTQDGVETQAPGGGNATSGTTNDEPGVGGGGGGGGGGDGDGDGAGSSSSGSNGGAIAGGVIGAVVFIAVVAGGVYYFVVVRASEPKLVVERDGTFRASGTSVTFNNNAAFDTAAGRRMSDTLGSIPGKSNVQC